MAIPSLQSLPVGFRFQPTDEELINHYLKGKTNGLNTRVDVIPEIDVCKCEPWDLPEKSLIKTNDPEWFFFAPRDRKYPNGQRSNRATEAGYWKATGKDRTIKSKGSAGVVIGMKKTLVFYEGRAPKGKRTGWIMHEYRIVENDANGSPKGNEGAYVLYRLFNKPVEEALHRLNPKELNDASMSPTTASSPALQERSNDATTEHDVLVLEERQQEDVLCTPGKQSDSTELKENSVIQPMKADDDEATAKVQSGITYSVQGSKIADTFDQLEDILSEDEYAYPLPDVLAGTSGYGDLHFVENSDSFWDELCLPPEITLSSDVPPSQDGSASRFFEVVHHQSSSISLEPCRRQMDTSAFSSGDVASLETAVISKHGQTPAKKSIRLQKRIRFGPLGCLDSNPSHAADKTMVRCPEEVTKSEPLEEQGHLLSEMIENLQVDDDKEMFKEEDNDQCQIFYRQDTFEHRSTKTLSNDGNDGICMDEKNTSSVDDSRELSLNTMPQVLHEMRKRHVKLNKIQFITNGSRTGDPDPRMLCKATHGVIRGPSRKPKASRSCLMFVFLLVGAIPLMLFMLYMGLSKFF